MRDGGVKEEMEYHLLKREGEEVGSHGRVRKEGCRMVGFKETATEKGAPK